MAKRGVVQDRCSQPHMDLVWSELCLGSRLSRNNTRFGLVFHVEGLVNESIFGLLEDFGRMLSGSFRPLLTCITPICPMFYQDPWLYPLRVRMPPFDMTQTTVSDFSSKLSALSEWFDIGYHGHFFARDGASYMPAFDELSALAQFDKEFELLSDLDFKPTAYAGGWWFITPWLVSKLRSRGFEIDTTINDVRRDAFLRGQPFPLTRLGETFWITQGLLEIPSIRTAGAIVRQILDSGDHLNFAVLALHDYDLRSGSVSATIRNVLKFLIRKDRVLSLGEMLEQSASLKPKFRPMI
jgi:hypothetical protein